MSSQPDPRPLVVVTPDLAFRLPLTVLLASLAGTHRADGCRIVVAHDGYSDDAIAEITTVVTAPSSVEWIGVEPTLLEGCTPASHLPRASLYPLVVASVLPATADRAIYLDVDTVAMQPLNALWNEPLDGMPIAAVRGAFMPWVGAVDAFPWQALGIPEDAPYFNNGVMLIDLEQWRRDAVLPGARALMERYRFAYGEQDAMNVLFAGRWKALHPRWNLQSGHFGNPVAAWVTNAVETIDDAIASPGIIHYNGLDKPWQPGCAHPGSAAWFEWLDRTPYRGWRPPASAVC
jgi:lipopolysaccharide biosynthesis glycosyltransferase